MASPELHMLIAQALILTNDNARAAAAMIIAEAKQNPDVKRLLAKTVGKGADSDDEDGVEFVDDEEYVSHRKAPSKVLRQPTVTLKRRAGRPTPKSVLRTQINRDASWRRQPIPRRSYLEQSQLGGLSEQFEGLSVQPGVEEEFEDLRLE